MFTYMNHKEHANSCLILNVSTVILCTFPWKTYSTLFSEQRSRILSLCMLEKTCISTNTITGSQLCLSTFVYYFRLLKFIMFYGQKQSWRVKECVWTFSHSSYTWLSSPTNSSFLHFYPGSQSYHTHPLFSFTKIDWEYWGPKIDWEYWGLGWGEYSVFHPLGPKFNRWLSTPSTGS